MIKGLGSLSKFVGTKPKPRGRSKTDDIKAPDLYDAQRSIWDNRMRFNIALCGRRFGKTILIFFIIIYYLARGKKVGVFAPSFKSLKKIWIWVDTAFMLFAKNRDAQQKQIILKNGGFIAFWSLNNKAKENDGRGDDYDCVIYEETQSIATEILKYHWNNVARATLSDRKGSAWMIGTPPNSRKHFFYELILRGAANNEQLRQSVDIQVPAEMDLSKYKKDWKTFRDTAYSNPHIDNEEIDDAKNELPELIFLQEYMAQCVEYSESPFILCMQDLAKQEAIFVKGLKVNWRLPVWLSFDFNKNPMACTLHQYDPNYGWIYTIKEFGAPQGKKVNIHYTCALIRQYIKSQTGHEIGIIDRNRNIKRPCPNHLKIYVTGDATGNTSDSRQLEGKTYYEIICSELGLKPKKALKLFRKNPPHSESFLQINIWMAQHPAFLIDRENCPNLRQDCLTAQATAERKLDKAHYDPHFLDCLRYFLTRAIPRKYDGQGKRKHINT